ncbi:MAG TPA: SDR family oxidoreductase [Micromonosporaceae bacterium]|nr:SDR family oxidoreductase [Micromonosporaceae bacterium]
MAARFLVTGGTGTLGRHVVSRLRDEGYPVRVLSRRHHEPGDGVEYVAGDLATGDGVAEAVAGAETILHAAGRHLGDNVLTQNLVRAARQAGRPHVVYISVVGADRVPVVSRADRWIFGYFAAKADSERIVAGSGLPWTTLRATQFYDLVLAVVAAAARLPVIPLPPGLRFQPIDAREVADEYVRLALSEPAGLVPEMGGPKVYDVAELLRDYLHHVGKRRAIVPLPLPGRAAQAVKAGAILTPDHAVGRRTWEEFLDDQVPVHR